MPHPNMPPTVPIIVVEGDMRRHYSPDHLQFFDISIVPARSVPVQLHFKITKSGTTPNGDFTLRCEPCKHISSFWERLDNYLV